MMSEDEKPSDDPAVERLVAAVMKVEREYAHALRGSSSDRLEGIRDAIEAATEVAE